MMAEAPWVDGSGDRPALGMGADKLLCFGSRALCEEIVGF